MESLLATIGSQALRFAVRSGIALTSKYAVGQCSRLLNTVKDQDTYSTLISLQKILDSKIKVIAPTIDLVEFKSGRGNVFLDSALPLTKSLHQDIVSLGQRIEVIATAHESNHPAMSKRGQHTDAINVDIHGIINDIKDLLARIDREIPLLQLAITASGESLSSSLPMGISPSRLLQASTLLTVSDTRYSRTPTLTVQVGPIFNLSLYMLFLGHASTAWQAPEHGPSTADNQGDSRGSLEADSRPYGLGEHDRKPIWKEVIHKARVRLCRAGQKFSEDGTPASPEYSYFLEVAEDQDDGRVHQDHSDRSCSDDEKPIEDYVPIHQISKIFYTDSGRLLNIGSDAEDGKTPVLLLKRDIDAPHPTAQGDSVTEYYQEAIFTAAPDETSDVAVSEQAEVDRQLLGDSFPEPEVATNGGICADHLSRSLPKHLDPEWIAMEMFEEDDDDDDNDDGGSFASDDDHEAVTKLSADSKSARSNRKSLDSQLDAQVKQLSFLPPSREDQNLETISEQARENDPNCHSVAARSPFRAITTSLSLIEMLIRLAGLQEFQQTSHLAIPDHILTFFLEQTSTTGLVGEARWRARGEAKARVGFDPYADDPKEENR